jgi:hypothetical protein
LASQQGSKDADDRGAELTPTSIAAAVAPTSTSVAAEPTPTVAATQPPPAVAAASPGTTTGLGRIVYTIPAGQPGTGRAYRIAANAGAEPEDLSVSLDTLSPGGREVWVDASPDGEGILFGTERFDPECTGWPCLAVASADAATAELVRVDGAPVHPVGPGTLAGDTIVVPLIDGPHETDLWVFRRNGDGWGTPALLTGDSPYAYHAEPAFAADGSLIAFECGDRPYGDVGTAICEMGADGTGFRVALAPGDAPAGLPTDAALRQPAYAPDGALVFEATWDGRVWRLPVGGTPERVGPRVESDGAPCALPDGRVASLWMGRPGNEGLREVKIVSTDGATQTVLLTGVDVERIACGG